MMKKDNLLQKLIVKYDVNNPILTQEILSTWCEYSRPRVFQLLKQFTQDGLLAKFCDGVYYIPTITLLGKQSTISAKQVIEKKYVKSGSDVFGYYGGMNLLNIFGFIMQVPNTYEIVTMNETTKVREITVGDFKVKLRRARTPISKDNIYALQILEAFNLQSEVSDIALTTIKEYVKASKLKLSDVYAYADKYPRRALKNFKNSGVENVFAY